MIFACSGPVLEESAWEVEMAACIYMWQTLGEYEKYREWLYVWIQIR